MQKVALQIGLAGIVATAQAGALNDMTQLYIMRAGLDRLTAVPAPIAGNKVLIDGNAISTADRVSVR